MTNTNTSTAVTTRERFLKRVIEHGREVQARQAVVSRWAERSLEKLEQQGRLVTERQYQDHRRRRILTQGDRARYVGPERVEAIDTGTYVRPHGQEGTIVKTERRGGETLVTFRPDVPAPALQVVELVVMTGTPGYFTLERLLD